MSNPESFPDLPIPLPIPRPFPVPPWWEDIIFRRCRTRVLIVSDGSGFGPDGFGLGEAVGIVKSAATTDHPIEVVTASTHLGTAADVTNFTFNGTHTVGGATRTLNDYEELWIFGFGATDNGMTGLPLDAIVAFMNAGGGVFATGDHENLGGALCGEIPRVKSMRQWYSAVAPPGGGTSRMDTNVPSPGASPQFDLQSDNIPQRIYPTWYGPAGAAVPHELLSFPGGTVTYLPDHPHEGRCLVPNPLDPAEWPTDSAGTQVAPEVVAHGVSAGPGFNGSKPSITPPVLFGVIGAYDGHRTGLGRIVVDSTWHHWININLNGAGATPLTGGVPVNGLYENGSPTPEYEQIKAYFRNIAGWLEPNRLRLCWIRLRLPILRWEWPIVQELDPRRFDDLAHVLEIGGLVRTTLARNFGDASVATVAGALVDDQVRPLVDEFTAGKRPRLPVGFDREIVRDAVLGGAMIAFAEATPGDVDAQSAMRELLGRDGGEEELSEIQSRGAGRALAALADELGGSGRRLAPLRKLMSG